MQLSPHVVVLILSYNGKPLLRDALSSYLKNDYSNFDVVVIDNGSIDDTSKYIASKFPEVDVFRLKRNRGYSGGFNRGIRYVMKKYSPDYVLISNNDVWIDENSISQLVEIAESKIRAGFVTGKVYYYDYNGRKDILQTVGKKIANNSLIPRHIGTGEIDKGQYDEIKTLDTCDDVFVLVSKDVILDTNGYDENFFHENEEADWQLRSKAFGHNIYFTPHAKIWHKLSSTTGGWKTPTIVFYSFRNQILLVKRHGDGALFLRFMIKRFLYDLPASILLNIINSEFNLPRASIKGTISGLKWVLNDKNGLIQ